jgi:GAF domain-containing protein
MTCNTPSTIPRAFRSVAAIAPANDAGGFAPLVASEAVPGTVQRLSAALHDLFASVMQDGRAHRWRDASARPSTLAVPLEHLGRRVGVLCIAAPEGGTDFSNEDEQMAWPLATTIATAYTSALV